MNQSVKDSSALRVTAAEPVPTALHPDVKARRQLIEISCHSGSSWFSNRLSDIAEANFIFEAARPLKVE